MAKIAKPSDEVRKAVSEDYARAVTRSSGCCSGSSCCGPSSSQPVEAIAKLAGYSDDELKALPSEAVVNSFGCGNPLAFSEVTSGQTVLDLGSGAGIDLLLAAGKVGPSGKVIGVDMTDEMIAKARKNIEASGLANIEVRKGIIEELPVEDASVDWVISNCVINLSPEKERVFREIARVLRPGGVMQVSDVLARELPADFQEIRSMYSACLAGAISEEEYLAGLRRAGLVDVAVRERLIYDAGQLQAFIGSELSDWGPRLQGKIWSAKIHARKPA